MPPDDDAERPFLVVTGSSAGGIDALGSFLAGLPPNFGAPVIIAQHLAPTRESRLAEIIQNRTSLTVSAGGERRALEPGTVFLVGPNHDVIVDDHSMQTFIVERRGPKPSIDRLFTTAADAYGDRLIAIVFSGMGDDGAVGARVVKERGGTVFVQEPASATYPAMPLSIPPNLIDIVARPEAMGAVLAQYVHTATPEVVGDEQHLRNLLIELRDRTGIDFSQYKPPTIMRRLGRVMVAAGVDSIGDYIKLLQNNADAYPRLVNSFLINVTEFFRDPDLFEEVRDNVMPRLLEEARAAGRELRLWSAGTSTGEEAYSLAIMCDELQRDDERRVPVRIFATDVNAEAIDFARRGVYSARSLESVPPGLRERYFIRRGDQYEVSKRIRTMTVFGQHDLGRRAPFPRIDLCFCRNVLIYFTRELRLRALQLFAFSVRDGGFLVLGKAEGIADIENFFRPLEPGGRICQRRGGPMFIPEERRDGAASFNARLALRPVPAPRSAVSRSDDRTSAADNPGAALAHATIGIVRVDRRYDIVSLNAAARALLDIHGVGIGDDLIHTARQAQGGELRRLVDAVFQGEMPLPAEVTVGLGASVPERYLLVCASPERVAPGSRPDIAVVLLVDISDSKRRERERDELVSGLQTQLTNALAGVEDVNRRLRALTSANDEIAKSNIELRNLNEQLLIDAEEAASSNEEVETLNEEMQATNEELETLNEELQATVEELNTTNDELQSRGLQWERVAGDTASDFRSADAERSALRAALDALAGGVVIVDGDDIVFVSAGVRDVAALRALPPQWWLKPEIRIRDVDFQLERLDRGGGPVIVRLTER